MPSPPKLAALCDAFPLGAPVSPLERVAGGLSNDLWRLDTSTGSFAVKRMVAHADSPGFADITGRDYRLSPYSPAIDVGRDPGAAEDVSLVPKFEFGNRFQLAKRRRHGPFDLGAFEFIAN